MQCTVAIARRSMCGNENQRSYCLSHAETTCFWGNMYLPVQKCIASSPTKPKRVSEAVNTIWNDIKYLLNKNALEIDIQVHTEYSCLQSLHKWYSYFFSFYVFIVDSCLSQVFRDLGKSYIHEKCFSEQF